MSISIESQWIRGGEACLPDGTSSVVISLVAYEHPEGIPARFCAGLVPAVDLSRRLTALCIDSTVRIIDPTTIAEYCNEWKIKNSKFRKVIKVFMEQQGVNFFFDTSEPVTGESLEILDKLGRKLELTSDEEVKEMVQRITKSGRQHGGEEGANNALLYMAAHPFSWGDLHHPSIWKSKHHREGHFHINLLSRAEERFCSIRRFLKKNVKGFDSGIDVVDYSMSICGIPCYILFDGEPLLTALDEHGVDECLHQYHGRRTESQNHRRVWKDFTALAPFLSG